MCVMCSHAQDILKQCDVHDLSEFLLPDYPELAEDWFRFHLDAEPKKGKDGSKWLELHGFSWASCEHTADCPMYKALLDDNLFFSSLPLRARDALLLHLCQEKFPGSPDLIFNLEMSTDRVNARADSVQCLVPKGVYWLKSKARILLGIESLLLQGSDLQDLPTLRPKTWPNNFLQNLAGNAFCSSQFVAWFVAGLVVHRDS
jgi:hypothetical protein